MIATEKELESLVERALSTDCVGLDTEFIWERTYYPRLGLIQLALSDEACYLIDPTAISDLSPLGELLCDSGVVKILHDAPQDLMILSRATGAVPENVFDTRLAAGFSGLPSTISLGDLITVLLDIDLAKSETRTDWLKRPLDSKQIDYALDDVRYLRALRVLLLTRIINPDIRTWLAEEMEHISRPSFFSGVDDEERYTKIKGNGSFARRELAVLRELAAWREREARDCDRPRGHIMYDKTLLNLARQRPASKQTLKDSSLLSAKKYKRYAEPVLACIHAGLEIDEADLPEQKRPTRLNAAEKKLHADFIEYVDEKCARLGIDSHLVGTSSQFKQLIKSLNSDRFAVPKRLNNGWRKAFLKEFVTSP